jgi:hypothetical protein
LNRYCTACGKPLTPDSVACANCGQKIDTPNEFSAIKNWLNSLSGWYRLFSVYACTHLIIVVVTSTRTTSFLGGGPTHTSWDPSLEKIFLHGILPIGGVFLLGLAIRWAIKGFSEERPLIKVKVKQDSFEANRKRADSKKEKTSITNIKKIYKPKKRHILFLWVFIASCIIIPLFILRISEKPVRKDNLKEFAAKSRTPDTDSNWITISDSMINISKCFSTMEVAAILQEKFPESSNYQDAYKWLEVTGNKRGKKIGINVYDLVPDDYLQKRKAGNYSFEDIRSLERRQLVHLLRLCCVRDNTKCRVRNGEISFDPETIKVIKIK